MIVTIQQNMAEFNFVELSKELDGVQETGVSFEGKTQKWETENDVKSLIEQINKCTNMVYLNLEGNTLGVEAAKTIGKALEAHPEFKKALWKDLFTGRLKEEIPKALKYLGEGIIKANAKLTVLDCSDNALGPNGMVGLVDLLKSPACYSLQELKLNNCGLGIDGGKMLAKALLDCHQKSLVAGAPLSLKVFIAGRNRLENEGAKALAKFFSTVKTLEEIVMPQNGIYHPGISALSEGFKANENIKILNLNDNTITAKGAVSLAEAFYSMQKLREINFGDCLLKTKGALLLADALQDSHPDLEVLNFSANEISADGGLAIAAAVRNKTKIRSLVLEGNSFGYQGRERIKEAMEECPNADVLEGLSGDECDLDDEDEYSEENSEEEDEDGDTDVDQCADSEDEEEVEDVNYVTALTSKTIDNTLNTSNTLNDSSICITGVEERPNNVETFCNTPNPSIKMFNALEESNKIEAFKKYLENYKDEDYIICLVFTILKCSALSEESTDALSVAEALYKDAFEYAQKTNQVTRVKNFFLIQLGLLKCEDKTFKPSFNMKACRYALKETLNKNEFPDDISNTFKLFLERFGV